VLPLNSSHFMANIDQKNSYRLFVVQGKISREDVSQLCIALLRTPKAVNTTFEIKSTIPFSEPWTEEKSDGQFREWGKILADADLKPNVTGKSVEAEQSKVAVGAGK
ncbi:MAG: hypothetical protein O7C60_03710, partial [Rickettsia endosymbiont of Ixodes persulcatus]|nr:hypothetical protein [Rickettsia endosymbiont of Ixodes persulcatus]